LRPQNKGKIYARRLSNPVKALIALLAIMLIGGIGYVVWLHEISSPVAVGFAKSNGRLEA